MLRSMLRFPKFCRTNKLSLPCVRQFHGSKTRADYKVTVIGAAGGIGQPLSLLLKYNPLISSLSLYDIAEVTPGVAADIGHVNTSGTVVGFSGDAEEMGKALKDADLVIVPAGVPRQPGMTRDDLFSINGGICEGIAQACSKNCPDAFLCVISNPVNSTVPIFAETLKKLGTYNKKKLFGVTTLDVCRAKTFVAEHQGWEVDNVNVPVIGGHAGITILPLLSQVEGAEFTEEDIEALTQRISFGGDEVVKAKVGNGSATLSMAHAGAVFANHVLCAASGKEDIVECSYVDSNVTDLAFFASPVRLGKNGIEEILPLPDRTPFEEKMFQNMVPQLTEDIEQGVKFVENLEKA